MQGTSDEIAKMLGRKASSVKSIIHKYGIEPVGYKHTQATKRGRYRYLYDYTTIAHHVNIITDEVPEHLTTLHNYAEKNGIVLKHLVARVWHHDIARVARTFGKTRSLGLYNIKELDQMFLDKPLRKKKQ